jgi:hypothetical protein
MGVESAVRNRRLGRWVVRWPGRSSGVEGDEERRARGNVARLREESPDEVLQATEAMPARKGYAEVGFVGKSQGRKISLRGGRAW